MASDNTHRPDSIAAWADFQLREDVRPRLAAACSANDDSWPASAAGRTEFNSRAEVIPTRGATDDIR